MTYFKVTEIIENQNYLGKTEYSYTSPKDGAGYSNLYEPFSPFPPNFDQAHKYGVLKFKKTFDKNNELKVEETIQFEDVSEFNRLDGSLMATVLDNSACSNRISARFMVCPRQSGLFRPISKTTKSYESNGIFQTTKSYDYLNGDHLNTSG